MRRHPKINPFVAAKKRDKAMTENDIENEINAKGLNAPRITPEHIDGVIESEVYFTGEEGRLGAYKMNDDVYVGSRPNHHNVQALRYITFCVLVLRNGFTVTGESACASPENFDAEIGMKIARKNAVSKIWQLEGYLLKESLRNSLNPE